MNTGFYQSVEQSFATGCYVSPAARFKVCCLYSILLGVLLQLLQVFPGGEACAQAGKKVLYVNSYHAEFPSAVRHTTTIRRLFAKTGVELRIEYMDTKRNTSEDYKNSAALQVKRIIDSWKPDVVIASDDNASKYLVMRYYKDAALPIVFFGVNWSVEKYGYPYSNVTGQIEVSHVKQLIDALRTYAGGEKVAILTGDVLTDRKSIEHYKKIPGVELDQEVYVNNKADWKARFLELQETADMLILRSKAGVADWDDARMEEFILANTRIPTGTVNLAMIHFTLLALTKDNTEFGEYAVRTAQDILNGKALSDIPITQNKRARVFLNMELARKMGVKFHMEMIDRATFVSEVQ